MKQKQGKLNHFLNIACTLNEVPSSPPPCGCRLPFGKAVPYVDLRIITEGAKYTPTTGACYVPIAATIAKEPRCQRSPLLVDVQNF